MFFFEEPIVDGHESHLEVRVDAGVHVATPHLSSEGDSTRVLAELLQWLMLEYDIASPILWFYTPMALEFSRGIDAALVVFDCMDELSAFAGAPPGIRALEHELLERAALVFTGGESLYQAKRHRHPQVYSFPSSVDRAHFGRARELQSDPADQSGIPHPRVGYFGVIDERMDLGLLAVVARLRPDWHQVLIGPIAKIDGRTVPRASNIHYLGMKSYDELPGYLSGWDVAMLPFARNEATRYISPTKTPEYLAAGRPVVSTPIADIVRPYGELGLVHIADRPESFAAALDAAVDGRNSEWEERVDAFLSDLSWDRTWAAMRQLIVPSPSRATSQPKRVWEFSTGTMSHS